jgi:two-component system phosphate regulon response regulator PhoB
MRQRVIVIEDEKDLAELVRYNLRKEGFDVEVFASGRQGFEHLRRESADLVVLDIMLPDDDGLDLCRRLRGQERTQSLPVIFLTAKGSEVDRIVGLEIGGDDYVTKPFSPRELVARVKAVLRRRDRAGSFPEVIQAGDVRLDTATRETRVRGKPVELTTLEFKLLRFLMAQPRRVFSRDRLLDEVWGTDRFVTPRTVDVHIRRLREKIEPEPEDPRYIQTVRGAGYRFVIEPGEAQES